MTDFIIGAIVLAVAVSLFVFVYSFYTCEGEDE
jgi:hypothetical protein